MKLEYLASGAPECPLLRLYEFDQLEASRIRDMCIRLSIGECELFQIPGDLAAESFSGCRLTMKRTQARQGLRQTARNAFECALDAEDWDNIATLLEPFCKPGITGYQWLVDEGDIRLLFSCDGKW